MHTSKQTKNPFLQQVSYCPCIIPPFTVHVLLYTLLHKNPLPVFLHCITLWYSKVFEQLTTSFPDNLLFLAKMCLKKNVNHWCQCWASEVWSSFVNIIECRNDHIKQCTTFTTDSPKHLMIYSGESRLLWVMCCKEVILKVLNQVINILRKQILDRQTDKQNLKVSKFHQKAIYKSCISMMCHL